MQPFLRRNGTDGHSAGNSFRYGRSVNNQVHYTSSSLITKLIIVWNDVMQRIERWWGSMNQWCTLFWIDFFKVTADIAQYYKYYYLF